MCRKSQDCLNRKAVVTQIGVCIIIAVKYKYYTKSFFSIPPWYNKPYTFDSQNMDIGLITVMSAC